MNEDISDEDFRSSLSTDAATLYDELMVMPDTATENDADADAAYCEWFRRALDAIEVEPWVKPNPAKLPMTRARRDIERCVPEHLLESWYAKHGQVKMPFDRQEDLPVDKVAERTPAAIEWSDKTASTVDWSNDHETFVQQVRDLYANECPIMQGDK